MAKAPTERWRWYAAKTADCVSLDQTAYPSTLFAGRPLPWPAWACRAPDGGVHIDDRVGRIDVRLAAPPNRRDELNWTRDFQVEIIAKRWLSIIEDLIDEHSIFGGDVYAGGVKLENWATLHSPAAP